MNILASELGSEYCLGTESGRYTKPWVKQVSNACLEKLVGAELLAPHLASLQSSFATSAYRSIDGRAVSALPDDVEPLCSEALTEMFGKCELNTEWYRDRTASTLGPLKPALWANASNHTQSARFKSGCLSHFQLCVEGVRKCVFINGLSLVSKQSPTVMSPSELQMRANSLSAGQNPSEIPEWTNHHKKGNKQMCNTNPSNKKAAGSSNSNLKLSGSTTEAALLHLKSQCETGTGARNTYDNPTSGVTSQGFAFLFSCTCSL
eukprot:681672-Amphidinium_carterae.1